MIDLRKIQDLPPIQTGVVGREKTTAPQKGEFSRALQEARGRDRELRFSAHALERMMQRGIELSEDEIERVQGAIQTAAQKGSRSSLVLLDEKALIVSVANRTVITALDGEGLKDQVVTEIDSAVIL